MMLKWGKYMNKELEYLLSEIKDSSQDYVGTNGCKYQDLLREELDLLLDHITNLQEEIDKKEAMYDSLAVDYRLSQEENERLKIKCDFLVGKKMVELDKNAKQVEIKAIEQQNYKTRNEKAIEYIKEDMYAEPKELYGLVDGEHLLNILQGSDK